MLSHIVIFWADPKSANEIVSGAQRLLPSIPGVLKFHVGKMVPSPRPVVDQTYQVALNLIFPDKKAEEAYQAHPQHVEFVTKYVKPMVTKLVVYDFA